ncbi:MAG: putative lipopolysaccharide heptosyltransferase III [Desulfarculaceae bacterium]|nr:putative lipopolysaccharide heptosyltransferase III [Desulfarculaceae bacterium]MCF8048533.1 putative lipopolysaccharide heptosyltransferase III [Desulfarculaceae bacterium]MCF8064950.1 putative lipopolysaccharide heptosyltransferase III [Desulfarculaceae bacterium]MCF8096827.1 putative lipopolysaccharide heptosyltransferase III [Desulfarculaceae bacterium]MCF8121863.1 putative lipopolysaccharide heptosyltransferase III [Desulfarculaceae bacterium]
MPKTLTSDPRRALIVKLGHIGDVLVTTPVISALKERWPDLAVDMVVNSGTEAMVAHNPQVNQVLVLRREHAGPLAAAAWHLGFLRRLRGAGYDLSLELAEGDRGAFLSWISGARVRVGFAPKTPRMRGRAFHVLAPRWDDHHHMVEAFLGQVKALGLEPRDTSLKFEPGEDGRAEAARLLAQAGLETGSYALVHPTSRWMFKSWTHGGNAALINHLADQGLKVVLTSGPDPKELAMAEQIKAQAEPGAVALDLSGRLDLYSLGGLIATARLFAGVDSAPMHMAAALGVPVLTIFGPSGEQMWGPWQAPSEVVVGECPQHPCGQAGCEDSKVSRCLVEMRPGRVCEAVDRLLHRTG